MRPVACGSTKVKLPACPTTLTVPPVVVWTGAAVGYADYREMLERERPDITVFASREVGDHCELVTTAGEFAKNSPVGVP